MTSVRLRPRMPTVTTLCVPYHLDEGLRGFNPGVAVDRLVTVGVAATWRPESDATEAHDELVRAVVRLVEEHG